MPGCEYPLGIEVELRHLRYFVAVAEERHFGFAAKRLHISQPPLTRQIRLLEEEIGAELFDRSTRPIGLTEAGTAFLEEARFVLAQARRAIERSRRTARGERGHLSVAGLPWAYHETMPRILDAFCARIPDASFELSIRGAFDQADALDRRWIDIGFTRPVIGNRAIQVETLLEEAMVAVVPEGHRFAERTQLSLEELAREPFVSIAEENAPGFAFQQAAELARRSLAPAIVHEAPDPPSQLALIAAGVGVGLHLTASSRARDRGVAFIPVEGDAPTATLAMAWRRDDDRELVRIFLETARDVARSFITQESLKAA